MVFAQYETKVGIIEIGYKDEVVYSLKRVEDLGEGDVKTAFTDEVHRQLIDYLEGKQKVFHVKCELVGTPFQKKVWDALCRIPYGETRSYKDIAIEVGNEKACRAVGMANNKNPIGIIVPCHRVVGANGKLVGYAGGLEMKASLLEMERRNK